MTYYDNRNQIIKFRTEPTLKDVFGLQRSIYFSTQKYIYSLATYDNERAFLSKMVREKPETEAIVAVMRRGEINFLKHDRFLANISQLIERLTLKLLNHEMDIPEDYSKENRNSAN